MGWPEGVGPSSGGGKFTATLARGIVEATPDQVFSLFNDNDLVSEYNEFCTEISDVVTLDEDTRYRDTRPENRFISSICGQQLRLIMARALHALHVWPSEYIVTRVHFLADKFVGCRITWGATGKVGPFSPRDFVTRCHNSKLEGGGMLCVNLGETLPCTEERWG